MPTIESPSFNASRAIKNTTSSVPTNSSDTVNELSSLVKEGQMQMLEWAGMRVGVEPCTNNDVSRYFKNWCLDDIAKKAY